MKAKKLLSIIIGVSFAAIFGACTTQKHSGKTYEADIVVYGGTSGAVTSAVQAARRAKRISCFARKHLWRDEHSGLGFTIPARLIQWRRKPRILSRI